MPGQRIVCVVHRYHVRLELRIASLGRAEAGKTQLALAVANKAIQIGFDALFPTAAALLDNLSQAARSSGPRSEVKA